MDKLNTIKNDTWNIEFEDGYWDIEFNENDWELPTYNWDVIK